MNNLPFKPFNEFIVISMEEQSFETEAGFKVNKDTSDRAFVGEVLARSEKVSDMVSVGDKVLYNKGAVTWHNHLGIEVGILRLSELYTKIL